MERGTKQCEKIIEWMSPQVKKKILIADAKVPLLWLRNKELRTRVVRHSHDSLLLWEKTPIVKILAPKLI